MKQTLIPRLLLLLILAASAFVSCVERTDPVSESSTSESNTPAIRVSAPGSDSAEPGIAAGPDGTLYVVWVDHIEKTRADVIMQRFASTGQSLGPTVRVNPEPGQAKAWRGDPPTVIAGTKGEVYVGWTAKIDGSKGGNILYLSVSRDGGASFEPPVKVNDDAVPASHGMHSMAVDPNGQIHFAWLDERYLNSKKEHAESDKSDHDFVPQPDAFFYEKHAVEEREPNAEVFTAVSADGGRTFSANKRIAADVCPCCKTTLLTGSDNEIYVAWRQVQPGDVRHMAVARSTDGGKSFAPAVIVSDDRWQLSACPISGAAMSLNDGALRVAWFTAGEAGARGLYISESRDGGKTFSPRKLVAESSVSGTPTFLADTLLWNDLDTINSASLNPDLSIKDQKTLATGSVAVAARSADKIASAYTTNEDSHSVVWLRID
jgi:hypothetical protein